MITLYTLGSISPNIRKITLMLAETGMDYTTVVLEKHHAGGAPKEFTAINANATVPTILDHDTGTGLFESAAILYYLAEKSNMLLPNYLAQRAEVMKWLIFEAANVGPVMGELFHYMMAMEELPQVHLQRYKHKIAHYCSILNQQLDGRDYLCRDYSIADIALYPWTTILSDMAEVELHDYPNLRNWASVIANRPAALATA